jgi:hypothetical protein
MRLYTFIHNLLNILVQIADRMGLQKEKSSSVHEQLLRSQEEFSFMKLVKLISQSVSSLVSRLVRYWMVGLSDRWLRKQEQNTEHFAQVFDRRNYKWRVINNILIT